LKQIRDFQVLESRRLAERNLGIWLDEHQAIRAELKQHMGANDQTSHSDDRTNTEWAAIFLGVLTGVILPVFYGLLGAGASVLRNISAKMRDSTLTPRTFHLAYVQLALGAVIGACIGLFATPNGSTPPSSSGLLSTVPLSASALCFVAGYGVEGVFQALESLVKRVFNADTTK
jgi:hypothetical protein